MFFGALVIGWIGWTLAEDAKNGLGRALGIFLLMVSGVLAWHSLETNRQTIQPDKDKCSQYVWVDDTLTCVPYGEEG